VGLVGDLSSLWSRLLHYVHVYDGSEGEGFEGKSEEAVSSLDVQRKNRDQKHGGNGTKDRLYK